MNLKPISEQTIVITGATSGIGLTSARMAAARGAKLVLVARNEEALRELADELSANGARVIYSVGDVADETVLRRAAQIAKANFGGFDTWVNNAGGSIYGRVMDVPTEDFRRLFDTNLWGVVNGSRVAVEHLRERGGALINLGSEVSDAPVPLQTIYSASKHAVKGFTDGLRMEIEGDKLPISVTLIKPTAINTPFPENAKNYLPYEPQLPPPVYAPELVAEAILYCAENPKRDFFVGEMAKAHSSMALNTPRAFDKFNEMMLNSAQNSGEDAPANRPDGLYETNSNLRERGAQERFTIERSVYQQANLHPLLTAGLLFGGGIALAALVSKKMSGSARQTHKQFDGKVSYKSAAIDRNQIREHMEVVGSDEAHIGTIDKVEGDQIKLTKSDAASGSQHHLIPLASVSSVEQNKVYLNQTATQARARWQSA